MKKILAFFLCFASIIALFSLKNADKTFSFEVYLNKISSVADNRPTLPDTSSISYVLNEYDQGDTADTSGILKALKSIWTTIKLIFQCFIYFMKFIVYIIQYLVFIGQLFTACFFNLIVW